LTVTGFGGLFNLAAACSSARTIADTISYANPGSFISAAPSPFFTTLGTGQPIFTSIMQLSRSDSFSTAQAMMSGSDPKSW
jgi:hypothetical protein